MAEVVSIYEAKTNLSKLIKRAEAGEVIYIGAYGHVQAMLGPVSAKQPIPVGVWAHKRRTDTIGVDDLVGPDAEIAAEFDASTDRPDE